MPFAIREQEYPENMQTYDNKLNKIMLALNYVIPVMYGLALLVSNLSFSDTNPDGSQFWRVTSIIGLYMVGLLQIISGGFLGYAILNIKKVLS